MLCKPRITRYRSHPGLPKALHRARPRAGSATSAALCRGHRERTAEGTPATTTPGTRASIAPVTGSCSGKLLLGGAGDGVGAGCTRGAELQGWHTGWHTGLAEVLLDALPGFCCHPIPALGVGHSLPEQPLCLLVELELLEHLHRDAVFRPGSTSAP